jgi:hypothetical protein
MGHSLKRKEEGWLMVVHAKIGEDAMVSFFAGQTPLDCLLAFSWAISHKEVVWKLSLY